ncbi:MAG: hypothetical protein ACJ8KU_02950 [Chthoniobacterales bacterium]
MLRRSVAVLLFATSLIARSAAAAPHPLQLNEQALQFARGLIEEGRVVNDKLGDWRAHKPSRDAANEFTRTHSFAEYSNWHLAIDETHGSETKARYEFLFGDFTNLHRCALLAVKSRARQHGHGDIGKAAEELLQLISERNAR